VIAGAFADAAVSTLTGSTCNNAFKFGLTLDFKAFWKKYRSCEPRMKPNLLQVMLHSIHHYVHQESFWS